MTSEEIKLRQINHQFLAAPSDTLAVIQGLCGLQAQFLSNALHALRIRCRRFDAATVQDSLVKNWTLRGTVHIFAKADLPLFLHCSDGQTYRSNQWDRPSFWNQRSTWALTPQRQAELSQVILTALEHGPRTRDELKGLCTRAGMTEPEKDSMFDPWGGGIRELCERGFLNYVVQEKKAFCLSPAFTPIPQEDAELEIARRYFTHYGPATIHDAMYFFHVSAAQVKRWLAQLPVTAMECGGRTYYEVEQEQPLLAMPKCLFLAGFDPLMLGYEKKESLYLSPTHMRAIFNLAGIVMPAILLDGQVVGKWKRKNSKLSIDLFTTLSPHSRSILQDTAESLWNDLTAMEFHLL